MCLLRFTIKTLGNNAVDFFCKIRNSYTSNTKFLYFPCYCADMNVDGYKNNIEKQKFISGKVLADGSKKHARDVRLLKEQFKNVPKAQMQQR